MNLIVPPIATTKVTGFRLAVEKIVRGKVWLVEFYHNESRLFIDHQWCSCSQRSKAQQRFVDQASKYLPVL